MCSAQDFSCASLALTMFKVGCNAQAVHGETG